MISHNLFPTTDGKAGQVTRTANKNPLPAGIARVKKKKIKLKAADDSNNDASSVNYFVAEGKEGSILPGRRGKYVVVLTNVFCSINLSVSSKINRMAYWHCKSSRCGVRTWTKTHHSMPATLTIVT